MFEAGGLEGSVEVYKEMVRGGFAAYAFVEVYHPLVAAIHEVNLKPFYAPVREGFEEVEVVFHSQPCQP